MGLFYKECNKVIDDVVDRCYASEVGENVVAPWGVVLNDLGKVAAISASMNGLGIAKSKVGNKYKFYVSKRFAGWWGFEAWSLLKTVVIVQLTVLFLSGLYDKVKAHERANWEASGQWVADPVFMEGVHWSCFYVGLIGVLLFFARGTQLVAWQRADWLSVGKVKAGAACVSFAALLCSVAAMWGSWGRLAGSEMGFVAGLAYFSSEVTTFYWNFISSLLADIPKKGLTGLLFTVLYFAALCGLAMLFNACCFRFISGFHVKSHLESRSNAKNAAFFNNTALPEMLAMNGVGLGVVLCGLTYVVVIGAIAHSLMSL